MRAMNYQVSGTEHLQWKAWCLLLGAAVLLTGLATHGIFAPGDVTLARAVQSLHGFDAIAPVSEALYHFGLAPVWPAVTALGAAMLWLQGRPLASGLIVLSALLRPISLLLKEIVERPRPTGELLPVVEGAPGFSFPSGHVFGTVLLVGCIACVLLERETNRARRWTIYGVAGAVMLLMGLQRVYAGAHWPSDAVAAWLWGGVVLFVLVQAYRAVRSRSDVL
jgi:undecaprenyl-diphosphatase